MHFLRLFWEAALHWYRREAGILAAALAYLTPFVLIPLLAVSVTTASWLIGRDQFIETLIGWGMQLAPDITELLIVVTADFDMSEVGYGVPWFGYVFFLWIIVYTFNMLTYGLQRIWLSTGSGWLAVLVNAGKAVGFFILLQIYLISIIVFHSSVSLVGINQGLQAAFETTSIFLLTVGLFYATFTILGRRALHWSSCLTGALVVAISFIFLRWLVTWWIASTPAIDLFGTAGLILGILVWVYLTTACIYYGAAYAWVFERQRTAHRSR